MDKNPIKILHVVSSMNPGGAEMMIMNLMRNIDQNRFKFDFVVHTRKAAKFDQEIQKLGGKIYRVPRYNILNHMYYKHKFRKIFIHDKFDIVHGHVRSTASIYLKIARKFHIKTIAHSHNTSSGSGISAFIKNVFQRRIKSISDYFFACSREAGEWLFGKEIVKSDTFFVVKNAIIAKKFRYNEEYRKQIRNEFSLEDDLVIGHVGRFHEQKNHFRIIHIFNEIQKKYPNASLILIGTGKERKKIEKLVKDLKLTTKVIFTGIRKNINEFMSAFDFLLFPSFFEGLPLVLVEAQCSGLPCIISDTITRDIKITDLVTFVSLKDSNLDWVNKIHRPTNLIRNSFYLNIISQGYDVVNSSLFLEEVYFKLLDYNKVGY